MQDVIVVTLDKVVFEGKANSIMLPGEQGVFEVLDYHKPLVSRLVKGNVIVDQNVFAIRRGMVGVQANKTTIIMEE
jgi:F-type H+-transporting ATPase subunit epsilon